MMVTGVGVYTFPPTQVCSGVCTYGVQCCSAEWYDEAIVAGERVGQNGRAGQAELCVLHLEPRRLIGQNAGR